MAKVWVLDTETKGTGAEMVPLEKALERTRSAPGARPPSIVATPRREAEPSPAPAEAPPEPRRFKVVNVLSREVLVEAAGVHETVEALKTVGSVVDVRIDVWDPAAAGWRPLSGRERRALWGFRDR